jgi:hypothetical protein
MGSNTAITLASRWPAWLHAVALLLASWVAVAWLSLQVRPGADVVAVAFPPWWTSQQTFLAATSSNAAIVRTSALTSILIVRPDGFDGLKRLFDAGAWLAVEPQAIAACFTNINKDI